MNVPNPYEAPKALSHRRGKRTNSVYGRWFLVASASAFLFAIGISIPTVHPEWVRDVAAAGLLVFSIACLIVSLRLRRLGNPER